MKISEKKSICILIPTKNRHDLLVRALESVFKQTVVPEEVIVINDGSTDDTKVFLNDSATRHNNLKVINFEKSRGVNAARNAGINLAKSEWIMWLDDDDELFPEAVNIVKEAMGDLSQSINAVSFCALNTNGKEEFVSGFRFKEGEEYHDLSYEEVMTKKGLNGEGRLVFRKKLFADSKYLFPEWVNGFESFIFSLVVRDKKGFRCINKITTLIHMEKDSRLSLSAYVVSPWSFFKIHFLQLFQHWRFYIKHPLNLIKKIKMMVSLLLRSIKKLFVKNHEK